MSDPVIVIYSLYLLGCLASVALFGGDHKRDYIQKTPICGEPISRRNWILIFGIF